MNPGEFWQIINEAREEAGGWEEMQEPLLERLYALDVPDLILWQRIFTEYQRLSYKNLLWAAAYIIKGGCSDDAFDYFRGWLTAQGKAVFLNALKNAESLADVDLVAEYCEFEVMLGIAADAYFYKLKLPPAGYEKYGRDYAAYNTELAKYPLPEEMQSAMAAEIVYDKGIDEEWDEDSLPDLLPKLYDVFGGYSSAESDESADKALEAEQAEAVTEWLTLAPDAQIARLEEWHACGYPRHHRLIVRAVEALPAEKRGYALSLLYARALNNLDREAEALAALMPLEAAGKDDALWHYRTGYALYYTGRPAEALPRVSRAIELGDNHPGTHDLLRYIKNDLALSGDREKTGANGASKRNAHLRNHCLQCGREQGFDGLCYFCRTEEEREHYAKMSDSEVEKTMAAIIGDIKSMGQYEQTYNDFMGLLSCKNINTAAMAKAAFAAGVFHPPQIYRDATTDVRDALIALLEAPKCAEANIILMCLAEIGGEPVAEALRRFDAAMPSRRKKLHWSAAQYLQCADSLLDESGTIVPLYFEFCYEFVAKPKVHKPAAWIGGSLQERCENCGCELVDLLVMDGDHPQLAFLGLSGMVSVPICPNCASMSEKTIVRYTPEGKALMEIIEGFSEKDSFDNDLPARLTTGRLALSHEPGPPFLAFCPQEVALIGGRGNWVQDPQFEDCPDCGRKMKLLAQLAWDKLLDDYAEGRLFVEICPDCKTIAVIHQQT